MLGALPTYQAKGIGRVEGAMSSFQLVQEMGSEFAAMYFPGVLQLDGHKRWCCRGGEEMQADFAMRRIKLVEVAGRSDGGGWRS